MRILVVDDSKNMRQIVANSLKDILEIELYFAGNGEEAEGILQENTVLDTPIELIMLDWMMPKMSGFEFLQKIRATELYATSPKVIMLTAETYSEQMNACIKFGVSSYVTKPFSKEDILAAVTKASKEIEGFKHAV